MRHQPSPNYSPSNSLLANQCSSAISHKARIGVIVLSAICLSACAGIQLYNEGKANQAGTASTAYDASAKQEADVFAAEDVRRAALLQAEIDGEARYVETMRRSYLTQIAASDKPLLKVWINGVWLPRLRDLKLTNATAISQTDLKEIFAAARPYSTSAAVDGARTRYERDRRAIANAGFTLKRRGGAQGPIQCTETESVPPFEDLEPQTLTSGQMEDFKFEYAALTKDCQELRSALATQLGWQKEGFDQLNEIENRRDRARAAKQAAAKSVEDAAKILKEAASANTETPPGKRLTELAAQAHAALQGVSTLEAAVSDKASLSKRLKCIDDVLQSVDATGEAAKDSCVSPAAAAVLAAFPDMLDTADSIEDALHTPNTAGLLIVKQTLEGQLAAAEARVNFEEAMLDLEEQAVLARQKEVQTYLDLHSEVQKLALGAPCPTDNGPAAQRLRTIIAVQIGMQMRAVKDELVLKHRQIELIYAYAQATSRGHAQAWRGLIGPLIAQQKAFHEAGIKPEQIAALLNQIGQTVALFQIAHQVGK